MTNRLVFFGNERLATGVTTNAQVLQALVAAGYDVAAVTVAQAESGNTRRERELEIALVAARLNIPILAALHPHQIKDQLADLRAEAGVLVAYGNVVPEDIIRLFPRGIINIHPSLLPAYRGSTPIETAMLNGDSQTGVSLMGLAAKMDAGPLYAQQAVSLDGTETKQALADQLLNLGGELLIRELPDILAHKAKSLNQDDLAATYTERITKADGTLEFSKPAGQLAREVRAYAGWPRSRANIGTTEVVVTEAHVLDINSVMGTLRLEDRQLGVYASEGVLIIDKLIPSGKKEMPAQAFLAGYRI